jgi:hypothetical protein
MTDLKDSVDLILSQRSYCSRGDVLQALVTAVSVNVAMQYASPFDGGKWWSNKTKDKFVNGDAAFNWDYKRNPHKDNGIDVRITEKASKVGLLFGGQCVAVREGDPVSTLSSSIHFSPYNAATHISVTRRRFATRSN